jgi:hypothetical protein
MVMRTDSDLPASDPPRLARAEPAVPPADSGDATIARTLGRRRPPPFGALRPPSETERAWVAAMARRLTRVPKGVFRYASHAEANAEWERWQAAAITGAARLD